MGSKYLARLLDGREPNAALVPRDFGVVAQAVEHLDIIHDEFPQQQPVGFQDCYCRHGPLLGHLFTRRQGLSNHDSKARLPDPAHDP
jgi:hypothetical protein